MTWSQTIKGVDAAARLRAPVLEHFNVHQLSLSYFVRADGSLYRL